MDRIARRRSEQHTAAEVPGGHEQAGQRAGTDQRPVVGSAGAAPGKRLDQLELGDLGDDLDRGAQQLMDGTRRHGEIGPYLFAGCSDDQLVVAAGTR